MQDITKPAALITGSSSGIGETFARKLSQKGYRLLTGLLACLPRRVKHFSALKYAKSSFRTTNSKIFSKSF